MHWELLLWVVVGGIALCSVIQVVIIYQLWGLRQALNETTPNLMGHPEVKKRMWWCRSATLAALVLSFTAPAVQSKEGLLVLPVAAIISVLFLIAGASVADNAEE